MLLLIYFCCICDQPDKISILWWILDKRKTKKYIDHSILLAMTFKDILKLFILAISIGYWILTVFSKASFISNYFIFLLYKILSFLHLIRYATITFLAGKCIIYLYAFVILIYWLHLFDWRLATVKFLFINKIFFVFISPRLSF